MPEKSVSLPSWLDVKAVAHIISASPSFIRKLISTGRLPASNISAGTGQRSEWRVRTIDVEKFMASSAGAPVARLNGGAGEGR